MPQKVKIKAILRNALNIKTVWEANPDFKMGDVLLNDFTTIYDAAEGLAEEYSRKRVELTGVKNNRDDKARELNRLITRFRSGMRAYYGPDSAQYGQSGATRASARKSPKRKSKDRREKERIRTVHRTSLRLPKSRGRVSRGFRRYRRPGECEARHCA